MSHSSSGRITNFLFVDTSSNLVWDTKNMIMFQSGDKFIHYTKYGGVNKGVVKNVHSVSSISLIDNVFYENPYIITQNNVRLFLDGSDGRIYKIQEEFTDEVSKKLAAGLEAMSKRKEETINKIKRSHG
jgi:hypothetical protein